MENILRIVYDKSINNKILDLKDIEKILEMLIVNKNLNEYILNINVQQIRSNNLASYSSYTKVITIYSNVIELMINNIGKKIKLDNDFEINLYKNLSILQVLLHEIEHANQEKIVYSENCLEAFLIRLSLMVANNTQLYEYSSEERLAEIESFEELILLISLIKNKTKQLISLLEADKLQRLLRGYHYNNNIVDSPLIAYFNLGNKDYLLNAFDWYSSVYDNTLKQVSDIYQIDERLRYGFPIALNEYSNSLKKLVLSTNKNFENKILISK